MLRSINKLVFHKNCRVFFNKRLYSEVKRNDIKGQSVLNQFQTELPSENHIPTQTEGVELKPPSFFQTDTPPAPFKSNAPIKSTNDGSLPPNETHTEAVKQPWYYHIFTGLAILSIAYIAVDIVFALTPANTEFVSEDVLKIIEQAIEAESKKNIEEAIGHYLKALKKLDEENAEHISPCYTSCSVRIAQLFEHQRQYGKAILIYKELTHAYLNAFTHRDDFVTLIKDESYDFAILRALTIAIRYAYLLPEEEIEKARELLMFTIVEAQNRIIEAYPPFLSVLNDINNRNVLDLITADLEKSLQKYPKEKQEEIIKEQSKVPVELPLFTTEQTPENKLLGLHVKAWPVFTRVLINAKDLYADLSIEADDLSAAISNFTSNSVIIQRCFDHPSRLTLTLTKLGVALQMTYQSLNNNFPRGKEIEIIQDNKPVKVDIESPQLKSFLLDTTVSESKRIFTKVLTLCDTMKKQERVIRSNHFEQDIGQWEAMFKPALEKSEMVSSASLGMIEFQEGNSEEALKNFKRAKVLAYKLKDEDYISDINKWIDEIEK
ncbi:hypothetical protein CANINC_003452 [Pichia inconspicua]|uniref:Mitochondrial inner membrane i-AAA protease supercomplex subunit MGR3 n=1 Tax=Pichia inconspicua TaxID=52247 RepID=A0A4T0WYL3_9ASCO|nr:hypothetical protein CANINC_003452 [[Candida] inconspicua]